MSGAGLPPARAVVRHPGQAPPADELRHSIPADGVTVVRRSAASHALLTEGEGDPENRPLSADPSSTEFVGAVPVDDERLREVLAGLVEPSTPVPVGEYVTVDERWQSPYGVPTRRYLIAPAPPRDSRLAANRTFLRSGEPLIVALADGTVADSGVSVDSRGHLFAAERRADCPVCHRAYGPCCGTDGVVTDCPSCTRPACGACRSGDSAAVAETRCARCGDTSCGDCARHLPVRACELCDRAACAACRPGPFCLTCGADANALAHLARLGTGRP